MIFRQVTHDDLGCASYFIGDYSAGVAAVVDPRLEIGPYLELARYLSVEIAHVLETHNHADHVSGHGRLAAATGATIHIHREAAPDYDHEPFDDGWELDLGRVRVTAIHTPGHRPEHTAFALTDTSRGDEPWAVLTGDSLFVGDIARPDLAVDREEGARGIFHSLHGRLLELPDETEVWPGHLGGWLCGGPGMDMKVSSTIGYEKRHNELLAEEDEDAFVRRTTGTLGPQPPNFKAIVALNRGPLVTRETDLLPLTPRQVDQKRRDGAFIVDVRTDLQFDDAHIPGGELQVLDVREQSEWDEGHIPGSLHLPYHDIRGLPDGIDPARPVAAICASGQRSAVAASLVQRYGAREVLHVVNGGVGTWERLGHAMER